MAALNPFKKAIDPSKLSEDERKIFNKYGLPGRKQDLLRGQATERKYFDSGDYAMAKAGKAEDGGESLGVNHPSPESIPHLTASAAPPSLQPSTSQAGVSSPVKENSILQRGVSVDEQEGEGGPAATATAAFEADGGLPAAANAALEAKQAESKAGEARDGLK